MGFLTSLFGGPNSSIVTIGLALAIVLILIVLGVWALKLLFKATGNVRRGRNKRLSIIDTTIVDQKRQLILIRRDNVEHLIMTGGGQDLLIETDIEPPVEQAQPVRAKRRPSFSALKPAARARKATPRPEQQAAAALPNVIPSEPELQPMPARQQTTTVEPDDTLVVEPAPQPVVTDGDARGKSGQNALEKLSKLTRSSGDRRPTSLRHTGLLRSVNRVEPPIHPQPSDNITQISTAEVSDSVKTQPQSAMRKQGAVASDNDEGKSGAGTEKSGGTPNKAGTAS